MQILKKVFMFICFSLLLLFGYNVSAASVISADMTQSEINNILSSNTNVTIKEGDYSTSIGKKIYHKFLSIDKDMVINMCGTYTGGLQVISHDSVTIKTTCNVILKGVVDKGAASAALVVDKGVLTLDGNIEINNYNNGIRIGYNNALKDNSAILNVDSNATINIKESMQAITNKYYDNGYDEANTIYSTPSSKSQGCGTSGSGIYVLGKGLATINVLENAKLNSSNNINAGIYPIRVDNFVINQFKDSYVNLSFNNQGLNMNTDFVGTAAINLDNAKLDVNDNTYNGITGQTNYYVINLENNSVMNINNNGTMGINNMYIVSNDSIINANNNNGHGLSNISFDINNTKVNANNNKLVGINIIKFNRSKESTNILDSTLNINNNGGSGIRFFTTKTNIKDSKLVVNDNGKSDGLYGYVNNKKLSDRYAGVVAKGEIYVTNSVILNNSAAGISLYNTKTFNATKIYIDNNSVLALNGNKDYSNMDIYDDYNSVNGSGRFIVEGGSIELDRLKTTISNKLTKLYKTTYNPVIPDDAIIDNQYSSPINSYKTTLTQFVLNRNTNKVLKEKLNTIIYNDPNNIDKTIEYKFRYNESLEDLSLEGNKAYIWAPISVINYDATLGNIAFNNSTAGTINIGSSITDKNNNSNNQRYTSDITIFGNNLNIAEKIMPSADKDGYKFKGWFIADNQEMASRYLELNDYTSLYSILNTRFTENTKVILNDEPVEELNVYAKWVKYSKIIINYIDLDKNILSEKDINIGEVGLNYQTNSKQIEGYKLYDIEGNEKGVFEDNEIIINYVYKKDSKPVFDDIPYTGVSEEDNTKTKYILSSIGITSILLGFILIKNKNKFM